MKSPLLLRCALYDCIANCFCCNAKEFYTVLFEKCVNHIEQKIFFKRLITQQLFKLKDRFFRINKKVTSDLYRNKNSLINVCSNFKKLTIWYFKNCFSFHKKVKSN